MKFTRKKDIYMVSRTTGSQDNILGLSFSEKDSIEPVAIAEPEQIAPVVPNRRPANHVPLQKLMADLPAVQAASAIIAEWAHSFYLE